MIDPNFVMKQGRMLDEYIRDNAQLHKRIAELNKVLQSMIEELEVDLDYRGMNIRSYCPICGEVSYGEFSSVQELRHQDTCPWVIANRLLSEGGTDETVTKV